MSFVIIKERRLSMQIRRFQKKKNGMYTVFLEDGNHYDFSEEVILKYELLIKKEITPAKLEIILQENRKWEGYYIALRLLAKVAKTKKEVETFLQTKGYDTTIFQFAVTKLTEQGYINDNVYAKSYVHQQIVSTNHGPYRIERDLKQKGVKEADIADALVEYTPLIQKQKVKKLILKKIQANHHKSNRYLQGKITNDLLAEGFDRTIVADVMAQTVFTDDHDIAQREYEKIYQKLSRKYEGSELNYKVRQKMYALGFSSGEYQENK